MSREIRNFVSVFDAAAPDPAFELRVGGIFSHAQLVAFRRAVSALFPTLAPEAIRSCGTWGELVEIATAHDLAPKRLSTANLRACEGFSTRLRPIRAEDVDLLYEA